MLAIPAVEGGGGGSGVGVMMVVVELEEAVAATVVESSRPTQPRHQRPPTHFAYTTQREPSCVHHPSISVLFTSN